MGSLTLPERRAIPTCASSVGLPNPVAGGRLGQVQSRQISLTERSPRLAWCPVAAFERGLWASGARTVGQVFVRLRHPRHCHAPGEQRLSDRALARAVTVAAAASRA